jgi:hypothetical protein
VSKEKTLYLDGEAVATGTEMYFAIVELREKGYRISTIAAAALSEGKKKATDAYGNWEWK